MKHAFFLSMCFVICLGFSRAPRADDIDAGLRMAKYQYKIMEASFRNSFELKVTRHKKITGGIFGAETEAVTDSMRWVFGHWEYQQLIDYMVCYESVDFKGISFAEKYDQLEN